ncbi:MAG: diguanylate cyclase [Thermoleophilia bacterium]|nr:diguanylate cyclase [Thermoleophilia bacterium]
MRLRSTAAAALLAALLLLTVIASVTVWGIERRDADDRRGRLADRVAARIEDFNARMLLGVEGTQGLYAASNEVSPVEFARYADNILRESGLTRIDWVERVPPARRHRWERTNGIALPDAGRDRDAYLVTFQAPDRLTHRVVGADVRRSGDRWPAMRIARDTGVSQSTGPLSLLDSLEPGFTVYSPVYAGGVTPDTDDERRRLLLGFVAGVQRADALLRHLREVTDGARITVRDGDRTLASSGDPGPGAETRSVAFTGRVWTIAIDGGPAPSPLTALMTALVGLVLCGATAVVLASTGRRERYAQHLLDERMTERDRAEAALLESEERHRLIMETSADPIITMDEDGLVRSANAAVRTVLRWEPTDLVGRNVDVLMPQSQRALHARQVAHRAVGGASQVIGRAREIRALRGDGVQIPVVIALSESMVGGRLLFTGIIHDMTEQRAAEDAIRRSEREQAALLSIATAVAANEPEEVVFDRIAEAAAGITGARSATILRADELGFAQVLGGWSSDGGGAVRVGERIAFDPDDVPGQVTSSIRVDGRPWGHLAVACDDPAALQGAAGRLERFAAITALAVTSAEARRSLAHLAATDPLTGLWNKRMFADRLEHELAIARRHGHPLTLAVLDLDHFKLVNDTHGHEVGDAVLVEVARRLHDVIREGEVLARVGGEEFAWILPRTEGIHGFQAAERARMSIAREPFPGVGVLTMSAGVCDVAEATGADELFRNADAALYWAKRSGRDRCFRYTRDAIDLLSVDERGMGSEP